MRNAIDLFASFIDEETYALFYYNGHAVGHNEDIYLASVETSLDEHDPSPLSQVSNCPVKSQSFYACSFTSLGNKTFGTLQRKILTL